MTPEEVFNGIGWHLECMALSVSAVEGFRPPADSFQMRMNYSLYLVNFMSVVDMLKELHGTMFELALAAELPLNDASGLDVLVYLRELRNGIVHRGVDPTSGGIVVEGIVSAMAPSTIQNRNGSQTFSAPVRLLRELFRHCEVKAKPIIRQFLEPVFKEYAARTPEQMFQEALDFIDTAEHIPDFMKKMAKQSITPEMFARAKDAPLSKLRNLLQPYPQGLGT